MADRISSLDEGYQLGDLSVYPEAKDSKDTLYEVKNNAESTLKQSLSYNGKKIVIHEGDKFPSKGIVRIGPKSGEAGRAELIYYSVKKGNTLSNLVRGFAGSRQGQWPIGAYITNSVMAEHHNAVKDAIINMQVNLGIKEQPATSSLNGILKLQETRFLSPKPLFRAFPIKGSPPVKVRFQNFSVGDILRYFWDFGDGSTSVEKNPAHTYQNEGIFSVQLSIITSTGSQGIVTKNNYITVSEEETIPFFYVLPVQGTSVETATAQGTSPTTFKFVDQTDGEISNRFWVFDDGSNESVLDPNNHGTTHVYQSPGIYEPSLLVLFANEKLKRVFLIDQITVF